MIVACEGQSRTQQINHRPIQVFHRVRDVKHKPLCQPCAYNFIIEKTHAKSYETGNKLTWTQNMLPRMFQLERTSVLQTFKVGKLLLEIKSPSEFQFIKAVKKELWPRPWTCFPSCGSSESPRTHGQVQLHGPDDPLKLSL